MGVSITFTRVVTIQYNRHCGGFPPGSFIKIEALKSRSHTRYYCENRAMVRGVLMLTAGQQAFRCS
jgi:hypothetical protein